jgi:RNA polymerase sigma-70 factor (ECF subfamily)
MEERAVALADHVMPDHFHDASPGLSEAFEAEVMPHIDGLFRLAMWWERDRREAEDLVQDALVQALQSFHRFTVGTNCRAWLVTILHHVRSNRRRAKLRRPTLDDADGRIEETVAFVPAVPQHLTDEDMLAALRGIPEPYQDIIVLCDVEELTYKEIADALTIPIGTVMSRLHRGRKLLRQRLADIGMDGGHARAVGARVAKGT